MEAIASIEGGSAPGTIVGETAVAAVIMISKGVILYVRL